MLLAHDCFVYENNKPKSVKTINYTNNNSFIKNINDNGFIKFVDYSNCTVKKITDDRLVYYLQIPKYHTLYVMRKSKTHWNDNCRCVEMFYKKRKLTENSDDDAIEKQIGITPNEFKSYADLERLAALKGWKILNENDIPTTIPKPLRNNIISFEKQSHNFDDGNEWAQVCNLTTGAIYEIMSDGKKNAVAPFKDKDYGKDEVAMVHNHQDGTFLSPKDFSVGFYNNNNIKYVVVHTENYIFIAELIKTPTEEEFKEFYIEYIKIRANSSPDECWNMFNSNPITRKYVSVDMVVKL